MSVNEYSKRTCHSCGIRAAQPQMRQVEIEYVSGSSQAGLSTRAVLGATLFGSDRSARQIKNWMSGNTKRQYKRRRLVWVCANGCKDKIVTKMNPKSQTKNQLSFDQDSLKRELEHIDIMFGELSIWIDDLNKLRAKFGDYKNISDAEARKNIVEISNITTEVKKQLVTLGEIYENEVRGKNTALNYLKMTTNFVMWGLGFVALYAIFFQN
jgi:hypothetical protein